MFNSSPRGAKAPHPNGSSAIKTYVVLITDTDGTFCELTTEAVNATVAVAEALALVNNNSLTPWDVAEVTCRVVASNTSRGISVGKTKPIPVTVPAGWDSIEAGDVW